MSPPHKDITLNIGTCSYPPPLYKSCTHYLKFSNFKTVDPNIKTDVFVSGLFHMVLICYAKLNVPITMYFIVSRFMS